MNLIEKIVKRPNLKIELIIIIISILIGILYFSNKSLNKSLKDNEYLALKYKLENQKKDSIINKNGKIIDNQKILITSTQDNINKISNEVFQLKNKNEKNLKTIAYLKNTIVVNVDTLFIPFDTSFLATSLKGKDSSLLVKYIEDSTITVPKKVNYTDNWVEISETITKKGISLDKLTLKDTLQQRVVANSNGFFGKESYEFQSFHTSPYFKTSSQQSLLYIPKNKTSKIGLTALIIGFTLGILLKK